MRIIGPNLGLAKGMLLSKPGITRIQIPSSMLKAPASNTCNDSWLAVVVKNLFPSEENSQMGRFLDPDADAAKSWLEKDRKPLSKMYRRMIIGFGVKTSYVNTYTSRSKDPKKLRHGKDYVDWV